MDKTYDDKHKTRRAMESNIGNWVISIVGALGGVKLIELILNRKQMKRRQLAEAVKEETDSLLKRYSAMSDELEKLKAKVDELYTVVHKLEEEKLDLMKENMELRLELKEAKHNECRHPNEECLQRLSQHEVCVAKKLLGGCYDKNDGIPEKSDTGE